jgi:glucosamine-6-phosphate deaminase
MRWILARDYEDLGKIAADIVLDFIRSHYESVLALPTGRTATAMYRNLVDACSKQQCFDHATIFNLDEYVGVAHDSPYSFTHFIKTNLVDHVRIDRSRVHAPNGMAQNLEAECEKYERAIRIAGGIDLTILGLGTNGHIGFNEPGSPAHSRTHVVDLADSTRAANAEYFGGGEVPKRAITMGIETILDSDRILLLASGSKKKDAIRRLRSENPNPAFPASFLKNHKDVTIITDREAG